VRISLRSITLFLFLAGILCFVYLGCASSQHSDEELTITPSASLIVHQSFPIKGGVDAISQDQFGNIYTVSNTRSSVTKYSLAGDSLASISGVGTEHYQFQNPTGIDAKLTNRILVADLVNHRIEIFNKDLSYVATLISREAPIPEQRFGFPQSVASDDAGNVYVVDRENSRILKFMPSLTFDRSFGSYSTLVAPQAVLQSPKEIVTDANRHVFALDRNGIVGYDEFGTFLGRKTGSSITSIAATHDTVFALNAKEKRIELYQSSTLHLLGVWQVIQPLKNISFWKGRYLASTDSSIVVLQPVPDEKRGEAR